jgi:hypothetical protein
MGLLASASTGVVPMRQVVTDEDEEITEEMVEGIYVESQYKIENIPGYGELFKRVSVYFRKIFDGEKLSEKEQEDFDNVMLEMYLAEVTFNG